MAGTYTPPLMPQFPKNTDDVFSLMSPYYREGRLIDFFFEMLVVDIVGRLPTESCLALDEIDRQHPELFAVTSGGWKQWVRSSCKLSSTFDIAVLDLWYRNSENATRDGWQLHPWHYAQIFGANYFKDDSQIDVWHGDALDQAKARIAVYKSVQ